MHAHILCVHAHVCTSSKKNYHRLAVTRQAGLQQEGELRVAEGHVGLVEIFKTKKKIVSAIFMCHSHSRLRGELSTRKYLYVCGCAFEIFCLVQSNPSGT